MTEKERAEIATQQARAAQHATVSVKAIAEQKTAAQAMADKKREQLETHLFHERLDQEERFQSELARMEADIRDRDAGFSEGKKAELQQVSDRLRTEGMRKIVRDIAGRTAQDQTAKENLELTIANSEKRDAERRLSLHNQQEAKRNQVAEEHHERQTAFDQRLSEAVSMREQESRDCAQEQATQQEWVRGAAQEQQNLQLNEVIQQDPTRKDWKRIHTFEQENSDPAQTTVEDFNAAAEPNRQPVDTQSVGDAFNTAAVPSQQDQSSYQEAYERYCSDLETAQTQDQSLPQDVGRDRD